MARVGGAEARGRPTRKRPLAEHRAQETLGKLATGQSRGTKGSAKKTGQEIRRDKDNSTGSVRGIRSYFEGKAGGKSTNLEMPENMERRADSSESAPGKNQEGENSKLGTN